MSLSPRDATESYFRKNYQELSFPLAGGAQKEGFRLAQAGALHAIASHFTRAKEPAIVTMPTGSGKTAVLIGAAFLLRAGRALVVTPSQLVREQVAEEFESLYVLRRIGAIGRIPGPKVLNVKRRPTSQADWERMREFDVVIATPAGLSPAIANIASPPADLFDTVFVDEAHHSSARTWQALLDGFPAANRVLFTATPFRRDRREIKGRFVYTYELSTAHADGVYQSIRYKPVDERLDLAGDLAIATAAASALREDRDAGYQHLLMVRTDSKQRAKELESIYQTTGLRLPVLTSAHSLKHAKRIIQRLRSGDLDGIICVDMLGEGFDLPALKVAAIHSPHKSLAATLQFIGRFARAGEGIGAATFLAIPSDIQIESERLYEEDAAWQEIVTNLSATRIEEEIHTREVLDSFEPTPVQFASKDVSLYAIRPAHHAKVFQTSGNVDLEAELSFGKGQDIVYRELSAEYSALIVVTRELAAPDWIAADQFTNVSYELFVLHVHQGSGLLFICASQRVDGLYGDLVAQVCDEARALAMPRLSKVLLRLSNPEFFNIGLRNRIQASGTESYRILAGSGVDQAVQLSDGRLYSQGHVFGRATDGGIAVTIGMSSSSRVWSSSRSRIPQLIEWCDGLAEKIQSDDIVRTNSNLDYISPGEELFEVPADVVAADWDGESYIDPPRIVGLGGELDEPRSLLDLDVEVDSQRINSTGIGVRISLGDTHADFTFSVTSENYFSAASDDQPVITLERSGHRIELLGYLNASPLVFYTSNLSSITGSTLVKAASGEYQPFDVKAIEPVDWESKKVDVTAEVERDDESIPAAGLRTIHAFIAEKLKGDAPDLLFYDHGSGEIADFVSAKRDGPVTRVSFYHCKGASGIGGDRVEDAYEVVGQCIKSVHWKTLVTLRDKIRHRRRTRPGKSVFLCGDLALADEIFADSQRLRLSFETVAVQPGFSKGSLSPKLGNIIAAADDFLRRCGFHPLRIIGSS